MNLSPTFFTLAAIKQRVQTFLSDTGRASGNFLHATEAYVTSIAPTVESLVGPAATGDASARANLSFLADSAILHAGKLAEDFSAEELKALGSLVHDTATALVTIAVTAVPGVGPLLAPLAGAAANEVEKDIASALTNSAAAGGDPNAANGVATVTPTDALDTNTGVDGITQVAPQAKDKDAQASLEALPEGDNAKQTFAGT